MIHLTLTSSRVPACALLVLGISFSAVSTATAARNDTATETPYTLGAESTFDYGCYDGCACPVSMLPLWGTFRLAFAGMDTLYAEYLVEDFRAVVFDAGDSLLLRGQGTYLLGGNGAMQHRMELDLLVGGAARHYDSGLVPADGDFPAISIRVAANGFACFDTVLSLRAEPATSGLDNLPPPFLVSVAPNPFREVMRLRLTLYRPGPMAVDLFDARGRLIRRLLEDTVARPEHRVVIWNGVGNHGGNAPAGIYFVRTRAGGTEEWSRALKLE